MQLYCVSDLGDLSFPGLRFIAYIAALLWVNLGFGQAEVVSSFTVLDYWVGSLVPNNVQHKSLIASGGELHGYQISPADIRLLKAARIVIGLNPITEPWLADWAKANNRESDLVWLNPDQSGQHLHAWLNPDKAKVMVSRLNILLTERLKLKDKESQDLADKSLKEIDEAADSIKSLFASIPEERRKIIAYHPSLESFAEYFGLKVVATVVDSAVAESADPSAQRYSEILKLIKDQGVRVIAYDEGQNSRIAEQLTIDGRLPPPISLSFEYLQSPGKEGDTWPTMMILNARKIAEGLKK